MLVRWRSLSSYEPLLRAVAESSFILGRMQQHGLSLLVGEFALPVDAKASIRSGIRRGPLPPQVRAKYS